MLPFHFSFKIRREQFGRITGIDPGLAKTKDEEKVPLDSDALLTFTYWFFVIIASLVSIGLSWDFWVYWKKTHPHAHQGEEQPGMYIFGILGWLSFHVVQTNHDSLL